MTDDEFWQATYGELFGFTDHRVADFGEEVEQGRAREEQAALRVKLVRQFPTYRETMWISGYPQVRMISIACPAIDGDRIPGVVRSIPVGWRDMANAETFRARFEKTVSDYIGAGWWRATNDDLPTGKWSK